MKVVFPDPAMPTQTMVTGCWALSVGGAADDAIFVDVALALNGEKSFCLFLPQLSQ
jgi:hypothetical protein